MKRVLIYFAIAFVLFVIWTLIEAPLKRLISEMKKHKIGRIIIKVFVVIGNIIGLILSFLLYTSE